MSINNNIKFLEKLKQGFKKTETWNKYGSKIAIQPENNNLDYIFHPTFRNINRLFVLTFKASDEDPTRDSFNKIYISLVGIEILRC